MSAVQIPLQASLMLAQRTQFQPSPLPPSEHEPLLFGLDAFILFCNRTECKEAKLDILHF